MELIEDLPLGDMSEAGMAATIKSEMPQQQLPPASSAAAAVAADKEQAPVGGLLQQLYEQQQIFAYHAQQAQQAHLNCARLVRSCEAIPEVSTLPAQVQRLAALRAAMQTIQDGGSSAPTDPASVPSSGVKRGAEEPSHSENNKRQRAETESSDSVVVNIRDDVPTYTDDVTGLGLPALSQVRARGRKQDSSPPSAVWCISDTPTRVSMQSGALAPAPRIHALPIELLKQDPTAHTYTALVNPETGVAIGGLPSGQQSGTTFVLQQQLGCKWIHLNVGNLLGRCRRCFRGGDCCC